MNLATDAACPLIQVRNLTKAFMHTGRELHVLRGIDLTVAAGEMLSIVGVSGAGKSTLLHILGAIDLPSSGSLIFSGENLLSMGASQLAAFRNRSIGFVFQFHHLLPDFTALENVMLPALIDRQSPKKARDLAGEILESVGIGHRLTHRPGELSGGEQQRVALGRALVMRPDVLLADEPTGNLDSETGAGIHELFFRLNEQLHTTMIVVTHNPQLATRLPRTLYMSDGKLFESLEATH